jgi:hypothetical protein
LAVSKLVTRDPIRYAEGNPSFESLVLSFVVNSDVVLVICYAWDFEDIPKGEREFRLLRFKSMCGFQQTETGSMGTFNDAYQATSDDPRVIDVTHERIRRVNGGYRAAYCLSDLGCFQFDFDDFQVAKKRVWAAGCEGNEYYRDQQREIVDFFDPFGLRVE